MVDDTGSIQARLLAIVRDLSEPGLEDPGPLLVSEDTLDSLLVLLREAAAALSQQPAMALRDPEPDLPADECTTADMLRKVAWQLEVGGWTINAPGDVKALRDEWVVGLRDRAKRLDARAVVEGEAAALDASPKQWRCFHCDEVFTDEAEAREHFGADQSKEPACHLPADDVKRVRELEADIDHWQRRALKAEEEAEGLAQSHAETMRLTKGHSVFMTLDYLEGEKLVLRERIKELEARESSVPLDASPSDRRQGRIRLLQIIGKAKTRLSTEEIERLADALGGESSSLAGSSPPPPQGWQPIETAPKDGTQAWLWWDGKRRLAHWHEAQNPPSIGGRFANWLTDDKGSVSAVTKPTLWHPLPAPPAESPRETE